MTYTVRRAKTPTPFRDPQKAREAQRRSVEARLAKKANALAVADAQRDAVLEEARSQLTAGASFNDVFDRIGCESFPEVAASIFEKAKAGDRPSQRLVTEQLMGKASQRIEATSRTLIVVHPLIQSPVAIEMGEDGTPRPVDAREFPELTA